MNTSMDQQSQSDRIRRTLLRHRHDCSDRQIAKMRQVSNRTLMDSDHGQKWWLMASLAVRLVVSRADAAAIESPWHPFGLRFEVVGIGPSAIFPDPHPAGPRRSGVSPYATVRIFFENHFPPMRHIPGRKKNQLDRDWRSNWVLEWFPCGGAYWGCGAILAGAPDDRTLTSDLQESHS